MSIIDPQLERFEGNDSSLECLLISLRLDLILQSIKIMQHRPASPDSFVWDSPGSDVSFGVLIFGPCSASFTRGMLEHQTAWGLLEQPKNPNAPRGQNAFTPPTHRVPFSKEGLVPKRLYSNTIPPQNFTSGTTYVKTVVQKLGLIELKGRIIRKNIENAACRNR